MVSVIPARCGLGLLDHLHLPLAVKLISRIPIVLNRVFLDTGIKRLDPPAQ